MSASGASCVARNVSCVARNVAGEGTAPSGEELAFALGELIHDLPELDGSPITDAIVRRAREVADHYLRSLPGVQLLPCGLYAGADWEFDTESIGPTLRRTLTFSVALVVAPCDCDACVPVRRDQRLEGRGRLQ